MSADVTWPTSVLKPVDIEVSRVVGSTGGGRSFKNTEQVVLDDPGYWRIVLGKIPVRSLEQSKCLRAMEALIDGRASTVLVPMVDCKRAPWPIVDGKALTSYGDIPFDDDSLFDDDTGFAQDVIEAYLTADAAANATGVSFAVSNGAEIEAGQHFSLGERGYRIKKITSQADGVYGGQAAVLYTASPFPLIREAASNGDRMNFDNPAVRCRLEDDKGLAAALELYRFADVSVAFVEDV